jgi:hypothetical protein
VTRVPLLGVLHNVTGNPVETVVRFPCLSITDTLDYLPSPLGFRFPDGFPQLLAVFVDSTDFRP